MTMALSVLCHWCGVGRPAFRRLLSGAAVFLGNVEICAEFDTVGFDRAVVVQAFGVYGYDCRYGAELTEASNDRLPVCRDARPLEPLARSLRCVGARTV